MMMSDSEIVTSYKGAKSKTKQLKILAQLNGCDTKKILSVLERNNVDPNFGKRGRKKITNTHQEEKKMSETIIEEPIEKTESPLIPIDPVYVNKQPENEPEKYTKITSMVDDGKDAEIAKLQSENDVLKNRILVLEKINHNLRNKIDILEETAAKADADKDCELCREIEVRDEKIAELESAIIKRFLEGKI